MRLKGFLCKILFIVAVLSTVAQSVSRKDSKGGRTMNPIVQQKTVYVSDINTTHLIFKDKIKYIDVGSPYFVVDTIQPMIKIKHIGEGLKENKSTLTNLTVITKDGTFYSIPLSYNRYNKILTYVIDSEGYSIPSHSAKSNQFAIKEEKDYSSENLGNLCEKVTNAQSNLILKNVRDNLRIKISGLYYKEKYLAIKLKLKNAATIDLEIDDILVRMKRNRRFMASNFVYQERVIEPRFTCNTPGRLQGNQQQEIILVMDEFSPNRDEKLYVDVYEKNGGRTVSICIPRKRLLTPMRLN